MEATETSPRAAQAAKPLRGPHGGWQAQEIDALKASIDAAATSGEPLRSVFERVAEQLGRKPNSIRNFYYAQLRASQPEGTQRALPFETFTPEEVEQLVERVITARAQGVSVRACVRELAGGESTRMLRYQNKYRSTVRARPELVHRVMDRLREQGVAFISPYPSEESASPSLAQLRGRADAADDPQLSQLFDGLDHLLTLALAPKARPADMLQGDDALRRADRLRARCDMLRIELSDEQARFGRLQAETEGMVTLVKEYIALPPQERAERSAFFCDQVAARLSAVECALMPAEQG